LLVICTEEESFSVCSENVNDLVCLSNWLGADVKANVKLEEWIYAVNFVIV